MGVVACGDDSNAEGGTAGSGGAAGDGGSGGLAGDACLDDLGVLGEIEDIETFVTEMCVFGSSNCLFENVPMCVAGCLEAETGLRQDCGLCIGLVTECIIRACTSDCTDPESDDCAACTAAAGADCDPVFEACAGFAAP